MTPLIDIGSGRYLSGYVVMTFFGVIRDGVVTFFGQIFYVVMTFFRGDLRRGYDFSLAIWV